MAWVQMADLYLGPMHIGGYDRGNRSYERLFAHAAVIDSADSVIRIAAPLKPRRGTR